MHIKSNFISNFTIEAELLGGMLRAGSIQAQGGQVSQYLQRQMSILWGPVQ